MEKSCAWLPTSINWEALTAFATLLAVLVALWPIYKEARRAAAQARNLRSRIGNKLILLRPTLISCSSLREIEIEAVQPGVLRPRDFLIYVRELNAIHGESVVLTPEEQDQLGVTMLSVNLLAPVYHREAVTPETARDVLELIDKTIKCFEKHGWGS